MIAAAIDIGTNSVLLLVAEKGEEGQLRVLQEAERITRLGRGVAHTHVLDEVAIEETVAAVDEMVQIAQRMGAEWVVLAATSAVRDATNGAALGEELKRTTGVDLQILSGAQEGEATFLGVASDPVLAQQTLRVVDSGGGSTELIEGRGRNIFSLTSIDIGHVRLTERFLLTDPPSEEQVAQLMEHVRAELGRAGVRSCQPGEILVGVGGTATTLAAIDQGLPRYDAARIDGYTLRLERVHALRRELQAMPLADRRRVVGLHPRRAPLIVAGTALFEALMTELGFTRLRVTTRGLRHGLLLMESSTRTSTRRGGEKQPGSCRARTSREGTLASDGVGAPACKRAPRV